MFKFFKQNSDLATDKSAMIRKADSNLEKLLSKHSSQQVWLVQNLRECDGAELELSRGMRFRQGETICRITRIALVNTIIQIKYQAISTLHNGAESFAEECTEWIPMYRLKQLPDINLDSLNLDKLVEWLKNGRCYAWNYDPEFVENLLSPDTNIEETEFDFSSADEISNDNTIVDTLNAEEVSLNSHHTEAGRDYVEPEIQSSEKSDDNTSEPMENKDETTSSEVSQTHSENNRTSTDSHVSFMQSANLSDDKMFPIDLAQRLIENYVNKRIYILAPFIIGEKGSFRELFESFRIAGYLYARVDGEICEIVPGKKLSIDKPHTIELVIDRVKVREDELIRYAKSIKNAISVGTRKIVIVDYENSETIDVDSLISQPIMSQEYLNNRFDIYIEFCTQCKLELEKREIEKKYIGEMQRRQKWHQQSMDKVIGQLHEAQDKASEAENRAIIAEKRVEEERTSRIAAENAERTERDRRIAKEREERSKTHVVVHFIWKYRPSGWETLKTESVCEEIPKETYQALLVGGENAIKSYIRSECRPFIGLYEGEPVRSAIMSIDEIDKE